MDKQVIIDREFARLRELLAARGVSEPTWSFADVWGAFSEWVLTASGDALSDEFMIGWQCSRNPNDPDGDGDHLPEPPEGVPDGPLFNMVLFWHFPGAGQVGVEVWYSADAEWEAVTLDPNWDAEYLVNLFGWGFAGTRAAEFLDVVEASMQIDVASRKSPALLQLFRPGSPEIVIFRQCPGRRLLTARRSSPCSRFVRCRRGRRDAPIAVPPPRRRDRRALAIASPVR